MQATSKRESKKPKKKIEVNNLRNNIRKKKKKDRIRFCFSLGLLPSNLSSKMISEVAKWIEEKRLNANRKKSSRSLSLSLRRRSRSGWVVSAIHGNRPRPDEKEGSGHMLINRKCT